jgi:hypothetical protein
MFYTIWSFLIFCFSFGGVVLLMTVLIMLWQSLIPVVKFKVLKHRDLNEKQKIKYRSFKNLDVMALNEDMSKVNIQVQSNTSTNEIDVNVRFSF